MYDDDDMLGEKAGEKINKDQTGEYAERWKGAMDDVPEFAGEWGYGNAENMSELQDLSMPDTKPAIEEVVVAEVEQGNIKNPEVSDASQLANYGFDTASRVYGLNTVLRAIAETDESGTDARNPLGTIYARLAPEPEDRKFLFQEIRKDSVGRNQDSENVKADSDKTLVGMAPNGEFYDKLQYQENHDQTSVDAIRALRRLLEMLETSEKFADMRGRAAEQGKDIVEYLVSSETTPTLSYLLGKINSEMSEEEVEELAEELEEVATSGEINSEEETSRYDSTTFHPLPDSVNIED